MGNKQTAKSQRKLVSLPPMRNSRDFLMSPVRFVVLNPFDLKERKTLKKNIVKNLIYFQTNYCITGLYTFCLAILTFILTVYTGGLIAITLTTSLFWTIVCASATGRLKISQNGGFQHFLAIVFIIAVLLSVLIRCVTNMYAVFLLLVGILVSTFSVLLHASLREPGIKKNLAVGAEYIGLTPRSVLNVISTAINRKLLVMLLVTAMAVLYCLFHFYTAFMLTLLFLLILLLFINELLRKRESTCVKI